jgi:hypothetical protein
MKNEQNLVLFISYCNILVIFGPDKNTGMVFINLLTKVVPSLFG